MGGQGSRVQSSDELAQMEGAKALLDKQLLSKHLDDLRLCIRGKVITPTDEEYSKARSRPFNHDARGYPLVVVQVKSVEDVVVCIRFITTFARPGILCVASGAHSIRCMKSGAFVIDLQYLNQVTVDVEHRTAMMEGGALMHKLDEACAAHNLATTAGTYPNTGVGGLSLSGGYGWLARTFGYTVDNLIGAEVVLPDGRVVTATDDNEFADLLWGLRGGAGNFGVVTKFMFRLHVLPPTVMGGLMIHVTPSIEAKRALLRKFDHLIQTDPKGVTGAVVLIPAPVTPTLWVYIGDAKRFSDVPALVQAKGLAGWMTVSNTVKKRSYHKGVQQLLKPFQESGYRYDSIVPVATTDQPLTDRFIQDVLAHTSKPLHPHVKKASVVMFAMGGACCVAGDETKTCLSEDFRKARYFAVLEAAWKPGTGDAGKQAACEWTKEAHRILSSQKTIQTTYSLGELNNADLEQSESYSMGRGAGSVSIDQQDDGRDPLAVEGETKLKFGDMNVEGLLGIWDRLVIVKRKYDPDNSFRQNVNITLRNFHASKAAIMRERTKKWKETVEAKKKELKK